MRALWRIFYRSALWEWRIIFRSPIEMLMLFLLPALTITAVWFTFSNSQARDLPIGVLDKDNTSLSRKLINTVDASPSIAIEKHYRNAQEMQHDLHTDKMYAALIIPKDFYRTFKQLKQSPVQLVVNSQYGTHSGIIQVGVGNAIRTFSAGAEMRLREKMGMSETQAKASIIPLFPHSKMAFNISLNYQQFLASTVIPALLHILATVVGVGIIGRELRNKSIGRWFWGVSRYEIENVPTFFALMIALLGKLFWHGIVFCLWMLTILFLANGLEHPPLTNILLTVWNAWVFILLSLWLGVFLTTASMSKRLGLSGAAMITAPAFAFSGITYPLMSMPPIAQTIASALPLTHYLKIQSGQIQMQQHWQLALPATYALLLALCVMITLATIFTFIALQRKERWGRR